MRCEIGKRFGWSVILLLLVLALAACNDHSNRQGHHAVSFANSCFAIASAGNGDYLSAYPDTYRADTAKTSAAAFYLKPTGIGTYLLFDGGARYARKMGFMAAFSRHLTRTRRAAAAQGRQFLLMGDLNIAHTRQDLAAWRRNQNNDGFLPEEREWLGAQLSPRTLVDVVRRLHPQEDGPYSWWSWLGQSFAKDAGWRIDYHLATPRLARSALRAEVDREVRGVRLSDHAPVVVDYDLR